MKKIILATNNLGKVKELNAIFKESYLLISQQSKNVIEAEEDGLSFIENAIIKARNASKQTNMPAIADDSGIAIDALNGRPGIYSARYAGDNCNSADNITKVLVEMQNIDNDKRQAVFCCAMAFVRSADDPIPIITQGFWRGSILRTQIGGNGFGYDPIFFSDNDNCSAAKLSPDKKNKISHRYKAATALLKLLKGVC